MYLLTKRLSGEYGECRINSTDFLCHFLFNDEENALNFLKEELEKEKYTKYFSMPQQKNVDLVQFCDCYAYDGASDFTLAIIKQK